MAFEQNLIAPCGMDCALCIGFQRKRDRCNGCRGNGTALTAARARCVIRNCATIRDSRSGYCYECERFPCARLRQLDARYRGKYGMSMIENLTFIRQNGMDAFLLWELERWTCQKCGRPVCVHRGRCTACGEPISPKAGPQA